MALALAAPGARARAAPARRGAPVRRGRRPALVACRPPARACARASPTTASGCRTPPRTTSRRTGDARRPRRDGAVPRRPAARGRRARRLLPADASSDETRARSTSTARARSTAASRIGAHGLPLIGTGDWNDGMNRVGERRQGRERLARLVPARDARRDSRRSPRRAASDARAERWRAHAAALQAALERDGWDGDWYRRAYFDDGTPLGSATSDECRIDSIAQSWAVLSGAGDPARARHGDGARSTSTWSAATTAWSLLFTPPFDKTDARPRLHQGLPARRPRERRPVHPRRDLGGDGLRRRSATATRRGELFSHAQPDQPRAHARRRRSATRSSPTSSPPTSTPSPRTSGAAAGPGTPARPAGCTAPASNRSSASACRAIRSSSTPASPTRWPRFEITLPLPRRALRHHRRESPAASAAASPAPRWTASCYQAAPPACPSWMTAQPTPCA